MPIRRFWPGLLAVVLWLTGCTPIATLAPPLTPTPAHAAAATPIASPTVNGAHTRAGSAIDIGGRTLWLSCTGEGKPTVILEAGLGADHRSWAAVQPAVAQFARVCSYDRAGLGQSDPVPPPRTSQDVVQDLHQLLQAAGETGPYILVGHSFGGLHVRLFAHVYPAEVLGLILVDAVHEEWWSRSAALLPPPAADDSPRLQNFRQFMTVDYADPAKTAEGIDIPATIAQLQQAGTLGDTPLLVLVAGLPTVLAPGLPTALEAQLNHLLQQTLPAELLALSSLSVRLPVEDSGHNIPQEQPDAVVVAIRTMLDVACLRGC